MDPTKCEFLFVINRIAYIYVNIQAKLVVENESEKWLLAVANIGQAGELPRKTRMKQRKRVV
jgi:hypothetical protein